MEDNQTQPVSDEQPKSAPIVSVDGDQVTITKTFIVSSEEVDQDVEDAQALVDKETQHVQDVQDNLDDVKANLDVANDVLAEKQSIQASAVKRK